MPKTRPKPQPITDADDIIDLDDGCRDETWVSTLKGYDPVREGEDFREHVHEEFCTDCAWDSDPDEDCRIMTATLSYVSGVVKVECVDRDCMYESPSERRHFHMYRDHPDGAEAIMLGEPLDKWRT